MVSGELLIKHSQFNMIPIRYHVKKKSLYRQILIYLSLLKKRIE